MMRPELHLRPSRYLAALLLLIHGGAILCLLLVRLPWWVSLLGGIAVVYSFMSTFQHHVALRRPRSVLKCWVDLDNKWQLQLRNGKTSAAQLKGNSVVTNLIIILNFKLEEKTQTMTVLICPDAVRPEAYRHLRAWLLAKNSQT